MGMDLMIELNEKKPLLEKALSELKTRGIAHSQAEHDYRVALRREMLLERDSGIPVTIISDLCRGKEDVALLKFERDKAEVLYKSAIEAINIYKLQLKLLENQIEREHRG